MTRFLIYLLFLGSLLYLLSWWGQRQRMTSPENTAGPKAGGWFRTKKNPRENWVQVYETASIDEARTLQARLEEEEIDCVVYEQGKKDIHGNALKGIGIAVPKTSTGQAQRVISRVLA